MAALTRDRNTPMRMGDQINLRVAANTVIFAGSLVCVNADGLAVPGKTATNLKALGRAENYINNQGANGAETINIRKGIFQFENSLAADLITAGDIGADCFVVDDQTVAKTNGGNTRIVAGKIYDVDPDGVWVRFA